MQHGGYVCLPKDTTKKKIFEERKISRDKWVMLPSQGLWQVDRDTYRSIYSG